jgi:hypothetical protein
MSFFKLSGAGARPSAHKTAAARTSRGSQRATKGRGAPVKADEEQFVKFA